MVVPPHRAQVGSMMVLDIAVRKAMGAFNLDATFTAPDGITALFGRSGAGKTTVINMVAGLVRPDSGHVRIGGQTLFDATTGAHLAVHHRKIGYVFQDSRLFPHMTVRQNLTYGGQHEADKLIDLLGLEPLLPRRPAKLSGGEKQRVALGRALMAGPQVLLLDEPFAALDSDRKAEVMPYLERLRDATRLPILYVSHAITEVARLATTLVIMQDGRVQRAGPLTQLLSDPTCMPFLGVRDAGAVIMARVSEHNVADGLTTLTCDGVKLVLPGRLGTLGQHMRLRIPAQDIILARAHPGVISALNVVPVTIAALEQGRGPGVGVSLRVGDQTLLARITRLSAARMALAPGDQIFAIFKASAVAAEDIATAI
jgi:molybdate transport system ATP-binding protein